MIEGKRILALVPAFADGNVPPLVLRPVNGIPLLAFTTRTILECAFIDRSLVCTDLPEIADAASGLGIAVTFFHPEHASGGDAGELESLGHALREAEKMDSCEYDVVLMLQPAFPLRMATQVREAAVKLIRERWDSVWPLSPTDLKFHPLKQLSIAEGRMALFDSRGKTIIARQQLEPVFHCNGLAFAFTRSCLMDQADLLGKRAGAIVTEAPMVEIGTLEDLEQLETFLSRAASAKTSENT